VIAVNESLNWNVELYRPTPRRTNRNESPASRRGSNTPIHAKGRQNLPLTGSFRNLELSMRYSLHIACCILIGAAIIGCGRTRDRTSVGVAESDPGLPPLTADEAPKTAETVPVPGPTVTIVQRPVIIEDPPARSALVRAAQYRDWGVREIIADSLGRIGPSAVPALIVALSDEDREVRIAACRALARMGPPAEKAVPALTAALDDPDEDVGQHAARALGQIGPAAADAVPAMLERLREPDEKQNR